MRDCSGSEGEGGGGPARRAHSVSLAGRRPLSLAPASLSISTSDLTGGGRPARAAPTLCQRHRPPQLCRQPSCDALHICRLFADGFCPLGAGCRWGHAVACPGNRAALEAHQLQALPEQQLLWLARSLLRQMAPVSPEEYRSHLAICAEYAAAARCRREDCFRLHLCPRLAAGRCGAGDGCRWSHRITDPENVMVLLRLHCSELSEEDLLDRLARRRPDGEDSDSSSYGSGLADTEYDRETTDTEEETVAERAGACGGAAGLDKPALKTEQHQSNPAFDGQGEKKTTAGSHANKSLSKEDRLQTARTLDLCHDYAQSSKCANKDCSNLHLCRYYVAGICPYAIAVPVKYCSRSHQLADAHNRRILAHHHLLKLFQEELLDALRAGYLSRNPITDLERRFLVQMCRPYQNGECKMGDNCTRLHVCSGYILEKCRNSSVCGLSHNLISKHNAAVIRKLKLSSLSAKGIKKILEEPISAKEIWGNSSPKQQHATKAADDSKSGTQMSGDQQTPNENLEPADSSPVRSSVDLFGVGPPAAARTNGDNRPLEGATAADSESALPAETARSTGVSDLSSDDGEVEGVCQPRNPTQPVETSEVVKGHSEKADNAAAVYQTQSDKHDKPSADKHTSKQQLPSGKTSKSTKSKTPVKKLTKEDMMNIARKLGVCRRYFYPSKCTIKDCDKLHLCRFFIASKCTYAIFKCLRSHFLWTDSHNARVLRDHHLDTLSEQDIFRALRDGYLAQNPVTDVERRYLLQMCRPYQRGFCKRAECTRIHICDGFVFDRCERGSACGLSHDLSSRHNGTVVRDLGLRDMSTQDIKGVLVKPVTNKEMWDSSAPGQRHVAVSSGQKQETAGGNRDSCVVGASGGASPQKSGGESTPDSDQTAAAANVSPSAEAATAAEVASSSQTDAESSQDSDSDESDDDSVDLPEDGPALCPEHASSGRCRRVNCDGFHICGFYLANLCRRSDGDCPLGHSFGEEHNVRMMDFFGLLGGSPEHFQELLDQMTLRARITFSNEAEESMAMCIPFNSPGGCTSEECCGRFHLCNRFLAGTCTKRNCERQHGLEDEHNRRVRKLLGLAAEPGGRHRHAWATDREVVELIRAKLGVKPGVYKAPEVVKLDEEETGSAAEGVKPEDKSDVKTEPMAEETKETVTEHERPAESTAAVSNGAQPAAATPKPAPDSRRPSVTPLPAVCSSLILGRRCPDSGCGSLHLCPHFLAGACRRQHCSLGHRLDTEPNKRALRRAGRSVNNMNHDKLVQEVYEASTNVRRSQVYGKLRICIGHNHVGGCKAIACPFIHVCQRFVVGSCAEERCAKGHSVQTAANTRKLASLKLENAPVEEVLEMLRAVHGVRSACK